MKAYGKGSLIISLVGDIDWKNADAVRRRLSLFIRRGYESLILNLDAVDYVDSSGLAVFIFLSRRLRESGGSLLLIHVSPRVMNSIKQAQLLDKLPAIPKGMAGMRDVSVPAGESPLRVYSLSLSRDPSLMFRARQCLTEVLAGLSISHSEIYDMILAMGEALGNAFDHGMGGLGEEGDVSATLSIYSDRIVAEINDCGTGIDCEDADDASDLRTDPYAERGRGINLMLMLADSVSIVPRDEGRGTCVRIIKLFNTAQTSSQD